MKRKISVLALLVLFGLNQHAFAATLTGKASLNGAAPAVAKFKTDADPTCKGMHPQGMDSDDAIVAADNSIKDVLVYVKSGAEGKKYEAPKDPVVLDQKGCQYHPKVFGIQAGQPIEIRNSDSTLHNVHALPKNSPEFNLGMPIQNMKLKKNFAKAEVPVKIKCEVHPWMSAYAGVFDHPFFAVTKEDGTFEIKNLPPGTYVVEAWHQKFGTQTQNVTVAADTDAPTANFTLNAA